MGAPRTTPFHIDLNALTQQQLDILATAKINSRGRIVFPSEQTEEKSVPRFNAFEVFLAWSVEDTYGVQRVRFGSHTPCTAATWERKYRRAFHMSAVRRVTAELCEFLGAAQIKTAVVGWRVVNIKFLSLENCYILKPLGETYETPSSSSEVENQADETSEE